MGPRTAKPSPPPARPAPSPSTPDSTETRTPTAPSPWSSQRSPPSSSHSSQEGSPLRLRPCSMTEQSTSASRTLSKLSPIKRKFQKQTFVCLYITHKIHANNLKKKKKKKKKVSIKALLINFILDYKVFCSFFKEILILYLFIKFIVFTGSFTLLNFVSNGQKDP